MIAEILIKLGAHKMELEKGTMLFHEGNPADYYYEITKGSVKMYNQNSNGKEFTQAIFKVGECFGEAPLFINEKYACSAIATSKVEILKLPKQKFLQLIDENSEVERMFLNLLATRNFEKSITAREVINQDAEQRILSFIDRYKKENASDDSKIVIPFTRQEIANFTGLRVETVIRTLSGMKERQLVEIVNRKLYF